MKDKYEQAADYIATEPEELVCTDSEYFVNTKNIANYLRSTFPLILISDDGLLWQEIYSLREKLKIAISDIKSYDVDFDDKQFTHRLNAVDFNQSWKK